LAFPEVSPRGRAMPDYRKDEGDHDGLGAASWFCLGLILIALVAAAFALF
jgi:hypothetical protein